MTSRSLAGIAVAALLIGCVTVPEFRALEREVSDLKGGGGGASAGPPSNARVAELGSQVNELQIEVGSLRGAVEEAQHTAQQALKEAQAARDASGSSNAGQVFRPGAAALDPDLSPEAAGLSAEVKGYEEAFREYRAGEYQSAIDRFRSFLQTHPSSDYADNALFWLGESYFKLGDHEQAVLAFDDVVKRYPGGNKVPDALYRQALALLEIGERGGQRETYQPAARQIFERLVNDFPDSDRVPEARKQLEKLGQ